ncbi:MOB kinase activator 1B [Meleagris gallopavo]|uniref:MOB kinase activator 1B n=1 Tax=Meleagris gallopavo TaxID=9103 RepID=UPI00093C1345|nr:MOB kinase activator 1B [Meleagris gallopavo]
MVFLYVSTVFSFLSSRSGTGRRCCGASGRRLRREKAPRGVSGNRGARGTVRFVISLRRQQRNELWSLPLGTKTSGSRSSKTFKPKKNIPEGSHQYELLKHAEATLGSGNLRMAVMLPEGEDLNEWVAVNTVDFFNQINMLYGTITDFCTEESCPVMSAGPKYEYHWADGTNIKKPIKCSAPKYIDYLMTWVQDQLDDETLFPSKIGVPFPKNFMSVAKTILKRLFRVYAHIYHQHFDPVIQLQEEAHLNTSFKHFIFFVQEFNLIDRRELAPLQELIEKLTSKDR